MPSNWVAIRIASRQCKNAIDAYDESHSAGAWSAAKSLIHDLRTMGAHGAATHLAALLQEVDADIAASIEAERRAELAAEARLENRGAPLDPREEAADRDYEDMMSALSEYQRDTQAPPPVDDAGDIFTLPF